VLARDVPQELVLSVVTISASGGGIAHVRFVLDMSSLVIVSIADGGEPLWAKLALVRLLTCVNPDVHLKISSLVELLVANHFLASFRVSTDNLGADEVLVLLFWSWHLVSEIWHHWNWRLIDPILFVVLFMILATKFSEAEI